MGAWLRSVFSDASGNGSSRRVLLFLAVLSCLIFSGWQVWRHGLDGTVKDLLTWLVSTLSILAGHGKYEERKAGAAATPAGPPAAPPAPPTAS
jgi:hypothetical protein